MATQADPWVVPALADHGITLERTLQELDADPILWRAALAQWLGIIIEDETPFAGLAATDGTIRYPSTDAFERPLVGQLTSAGAVAALFGLTDRAAAHGALLQEAIDQLGLDLADWKAEFLHWLGLILKSTGMLADIVPAADGSIMFPSEAVLRAAVLPRLTCWGALASLIAVAEVRSKRADSRN